MAFGELLDLISVEQIKHEGFTQGMTEQDERDDFFEKLNWK